MLVGIPNKEGLTKEQFVEKVRGIVTRLTGEDAPDKLPLDVCLKVIQELGVSEEDARALMVIGVASGRLKPIIKEEEEPEVLH